MKNSHDVMKLFSSDPKLRPSRLIFDSDSGDVACIFRSLPHLADSFEHHIPRNTWRSYGSWSSGESCEDTLALCRKGTLEHVSKAKTLMSKLEQLIEVPTPTLIESPMGMYPEVGDYLAGSPTPMRDIEKTLGSKMGVRIYVCHATSAGTTSQMVLNRGIAILAFVQHLSLLRPVELFTITSENGNANRSHYGASFIITQIPTQPLDLASACYAFTSAGYDRNISFAWAKKFWGFTGGWAWRASPLSESYLQRKRKFLNLTPEDILIPPIVHSDPLLVDPINWINDKIRRYAQKPQGA